MRRLAAHGKRALGGQPIPTVRSERLAPMNRRSFLWLSAALGLAAAPRVGFGAPLKELRVGYQKTAILLVVKARKLLENRKVAVARGSSAHNLLVTALEAANLAWSDISPVYLAPADAASAFARGAVDARSIWDRHRGIERECAPAAA